VKGKGGRGKEGAGRASMRHGLRGFDAPDWSYGTSTSVSTWMGDCEPGSVRRCKYATDRLHIAVIVLTRTLK